LIEPVKVVATIAKGPAGAQEHLLAIALQDQETDFVIVFVLHEHSDIRYAIGIEVAALQERVDPT
jgi:hypothetical protein